MIEQFDWLCRSLDYLYYHNSGQRRLQCLAVVPSLLFYVVVRDAMLGLWRLLHVEVAVPKPDYDTGIVSQRILEYRPDVSSLSVDFIGFVIPSNSFCRSARKITPSRA